MVIDADGVCVTARERPQLVRIRAETTGGGLRMEMHGRDSITVPYPASDARAARTWIWGQTCDALDAGDTAARWMSGAIGKPVRLVAMDHRVKRRPDPDCTLPEDEVSFADCFPILVIGRSSLDDLNARTPAPASMRRFRPNLVVSGGAPFAEDGWRRIRIGSVVFEGVENCERCEFPTIDPDTGIPDPRREPMRTLAPLSQASHRGGVPRPEPGAARPRDRSGGRSGDRAGIRGARLSRLPVSLAIEACRDTGK